MNTVLVTGAGRGIGLATARAFLGAGWKVLALDKDFSRFDLKGAEKIEFDLQNLPAIKQLAKHEIHTLVNNAGVLFCDPYDAIPDKHKREVLTVNLEAPAKLIEVISIQMKKRGKDPARGIAGRIVNVGSVAAFTGHPDLWYGITKAGILNLTKAWAKELGPHGVLVNAVAPGPTQTAMYDQLPQSRKDGVMRSVHSGRVCRPEEVAAAILWLGTSCPAYVNGTTLDVNDGSYPR
ncbi:MAG TPA: SDR family oxidoreductase [Burkholderiales bacterium]|nr:SDR family oxidoreductase [Burkholderiales bacterium]